MTSNELRRMERIYDLVRKARREHLLTPHTFSGTEIGKAIRGQIAFVPLVRYIFSFDSYHELPFRHHTTF